MMASKESFVFLVAAHGGVSIEHASRATDAVLAGIGAYLSAPHRELVADELPPGLARALRAGTRVAAPIDSPGGAGARSNAERCGGLIASAGGAGARSNAERCGGLIASPGGAGARSNTERCGGLIDERVLEPGTTAGQARELVASVCRALAEDLSTEALLAIRRSVPPEIAAFLAPLASLASPAPEAPARAVPGAHREILAEGRPGSPRPVSEARARRA